MGQLNNYQNSINNLKFVISKACSENNIDFNKLRWEELAWTTDNTFPTRVGDLSGYYYIVEQEYERLSLDKKIKSQDLNEFLRLLNLIYENCKNTKYFFVLLNEIRKYPHIEFKNILKYLEKDLEIIKEPKKIMTFLEVLKKIQIKLDYLVSQKDYETINTIEKLLIKNNFQEIADLYLKN